MTSVQHQRYLFYALFLALGIIVFMMLRGYIATMIGAVLLSYIFFKPYEWVLKKVKKPGIAAGIILVLIVLLVTIPLYVIGVYVYKEATSVLANPAITELSLCVGSNNLGCKAITDLQEQFPQVDIQSELQDLTKKFTALISNALSKVVDQTIKVLIMLFVIFYLLIDGRLIVSHIARLLTIKKPHAENLIKTMRETMNAVVYGQLAAALAQGAVAALGFWLIADIRNPLLWGVITAFVSLLPVLGAGLVWAPISIYLIANGLITGAHGMLVRGIILGIYGVAIISTVDNLIKTKLISKHAKIHQIVAFMGVFGGLALFGFVGVFVGPIILALFVNFVSIYMTEELTDEPAS